MVYIVRAGFPRPLYVLILSSPHHLQTTGGQSMSLIGREPNATASHLSQLPAAIHVSDRAGTPASTIVSL